jgi:2-haloacid dehalogenase
VLNIKALVFDVGGTVLDWHAGVSASLRQLGEEKGVSANWPRVANHWRYAALNAMLTQYKGRAQGLNIDGVHRMTLDDVLEEFSLNIFNQNDRDRLTGSWHNLHAWPDAKSAWPVLRDRFLLSTLTILSVSLIVDSSRHAGISWDCVISCEFLDEYKPHPTVYDAAPRLLQLEPSEIMMIACHNFDLLAAREQGLKTAFVRRTEEWGDLDLFDQIDEPDQVHDVIAEDFHDLVEKIAS